MHHQNHSKKRINQQPQYSCLGTMRKQIVSSSPWKRFLYDWPFSLKQLLKKIQKLRKFLNDLSISNDAFEKAK